MYHSIKTSRTLNSDNIWIVQIIYVKFSAQIKIEQKFISSLNNPKTKNPINLD